MNWAGMKFILLGYMNYAEMLKVYNLVLFSLAFGTSLLDFSKSHPVSFLLSSLTEGWRVKRGASSQTQSLR